MRARNTANKDKKDKEIKEIKEKIETENKEKNDELVVCSDPVISSDDSRVATANLEESPCNSTPKDKEESKFA